MARLSLAADNFWRGTVVRAEAIVERTSTEESVGYVW